MNVISERGAGVPRKQVKIDKMSTRDCSPCVSLRVLSDCIMCTRGTSLFTDSVHGRFVCERVEEEAEGNKDSQIWSPQAETVAHGFLWPSSC